MTSDSNPDHGNRGTDFYTSYSSRPCVFLTFDVFIGYDNDYPGFSRLDISVTKNGIHFSRHGDYEITIVERSYSVWWMSIGNK